MDVGKVIMAILFGSVMVLAGACVVFHIQDLLKARKERKVA